jgi:osmotically-inducible protein OsmY
MDNAKLRQNVMDELEFEPSIDAAHIGVTAENGVVTLTGYVTNYAQKMSAEAAARRVRGVRGLANEIEVRYPGHAPNADDEIAQRALNMLGWNVSVPANAVQVTVQDGWVTLRGEVQWQYQRTAAADAVSGLSGITGIVNNITIKPTVKVADIKGKIEAALKRRAEVEAMNIAVTVKDGGVVVLNGKVDNWDERQAVDSAAWGAAGVRSVEDHLVIAA